MAWRVKKADSQTVAGWHQDSVYGSPVPVALGDLKHEESDDPKSILARGQYISDPFNESKAVDFVLQPGEMVMFHNSLVHGSSINVGPDRRFLLLVEMVLTWAERPRGRESAMLLRGVDTLDRFDDEPRPDGEFTETALAKLEACSGLPGQAALRGQPLRPQRGLRRPARRHMTPA